MTDLSVSNPITVQGAVELLRAMRWDPQEAPDGGWWATCLACETGRLKITENGNVAVFQCSNKCTHAEIESKFYSEIGKMERGMISKGIVSPGPAPEPVHWPEPMHPAAMYGVIGDLVSTIEPHSEADPAALTMTFLTALGAVIGRGIGAVAEGDHHGANINTAIVGQSSKGRKGVSLSRAKQVVTRIDPLFADSRIMGGLSSGEGLVWQVRDPINRRRQPRNDHERGEVDADGLFTELEDAGVDDKRLLVVEGEFAQVLRSMARTGNVLSTVLRNLWDSGDVAQLTKNSPARTTGAHISIIGHITSDELRRELTATDAANGFANRFLWACARRSKALPDGGSLDEGDLTRSVERIHFALTAAKSGSVLMRDDQARDLWHKVYPSLSDGQPGMLGAVTSRAEAQVLRLSVIYAVLDCAEEIRLEHLQAALAVWDYCDRSAAYIFGRALGDPVAQKILDALRAAGGEGMTRTAVRDLLGRHERVERIDGALALLEERRLVVGERVQTSGRPVDLWRSTGEVEGGQHVDRPEWVKYLACDISDRSDQSGADEELSSLMSLRSQPQSPDEQELSWLSSLSSQNGEPEKRIPFEDPPPPDPALA